MTSYDRTRSRQNSTDEFSIPVAHYHMDGTLLSTFNVGPYITVMHGRQFRDNPHDNLVKGVRAPATACEDISTTFVPSVTSLPASYDWTSTAIFNGPGVPLASASHSQVFADFVGRVGDPDPGTLGRLLTKLITQIPPEVELGNFALEAKDAALLIPSLLESWEKFAKADLPRRMGRKWPQTIAEGHLASETAKTSLWWQFGVAPLLSDLEALTTLSSAVTSKLESLRRKNNRVSTRRVGPWKGPDVLPAYRPWTNLDGTSLFAGSNYRLQYRLESIESVYRAQAKLEAALTGLEGWEGITAAYLAAAGLNNPVAVVWQALPWTFVIDWVLPIGDRLSRVGATPIRGHWNVTDACWSMTSTAVYSIGINRFTTHNDQSASVYELGKLHCRRFIRGTVFPDYPVSWPLTAGQAGIALALLLGASH